MPESCTRIRATVSRIDSTQEPDALAAHVRICAGAPGNRRLYRDACCVAGLRPVPCASHHFGAAVIDIHVEHHSPRRPWRYAPEMAAMLGHAMGT